MRGEYVRVKFVWPGEERGGSRRKRGRGNLIEKSVQRQKRVIILSFSLSLSSPPFTKKTILSMDELEWNNTLPHLSPLHVIFPETKWSSCRIETNGGGGGDDWLMNWLIGESVCRDWIEYSRKFPSPYRLFSLSSLRWTNAASHVLYPVGSLFSVACSRVLCCDWSVRSLALL